MAGEHERGAKELPGVGDVGRAVAERARRQPWAVAGIALATGYVLGGGFFSRPTRWLVRAGLGALAVPSVRARAIGVWRRGRGSREQAPSAVPA